YRLVGHDDGWVRAEIRRATYTGLRPGRYLFQVQAELRDGGWTEPVSLDVVLEPSLWQRTEFWALFVLGMGMLGVSVYLLRVGQLKARERWLEARVQERTRELARANEELEANVRTLRQTQAQLVQAGRMAAVGQLAAGVGHEINNPLAYIVSNLEHASEESDMLARELGETRAAGTRLREVGQALREALHGADRVRRIVRDLKTFSRPDDEKQGPVELGAVLDSAVKIAMGELRPRAKLVRDYGDVTWVEGNEARLAQVFLNLLINAAQALPEGRAEQNEVRLVTRGGADGWVVAEVRDTGSGISPESLGRIFDPFYTTKPVGVGTGLGLSLCHAYVTAMGGTISVESELGKGSVFRVSLRRARAPGAGVAVEARRGGGWSVRGPGERASSPTGYPTVPDSRRSTTEPTAPTVANEVSKPAVEPPSGALQPAFVDARAVSERASAPRFSESSPGDRTSTGHASAPVREPPTEDRVAVSGHAPSSAPSPRPSMESSSAPSDVSAIAHRASEVAGATTGRTFVTGHAPAVEPSSGMRSASESASSTKPASGSSPRAEASPSPARTTAEPASPVVSPSSTLTTSTVDPASPHAATVASATSVDSSSSRPAPGSTEVSMSSPTRGPTQDAPQGARPAESEARPPAPEPVVPQARGRVLVVDDDALVSGAIRRTLSRENDVDVVVSARQALERLSGPEPRHYDVVLCDLMMPEMTGMDLHEALGHAAPAIAERMVFITGGAFTPTARTFLERVENPRVEKPFDPESLRALVRSEVARARREAAGRAA
ncbi:ATP-binding protein, partial [Myxococcus fulvus]|uniref:hybrid sensor histidine kinase/response regulator n=1 Tax=Myxococcus fulvus TaxID=33 RepID=UPI003B9A69F5